MADEYRDRLIVALDVGGYDEAAKLVEMLAPRVGLFKVGSVLFTREGPRICRLVKDAGAGLFLDMKFHDIPNTVYGAVRSA
ncbi:MAG: pyrF, partial [Candidatus Krumholzibacteriota bacterium]|nr:pyrF [Candidatus Krumholzibacteriota bacterium]